MVGVVLSMSEKDVSGQACIVDGKVVVNNPQGDGIPAVLYPAEEGVTVYVNNELLESPREVFEDDVIEITSPSKVEDARCVVSLTPDAYIAELTVFPRRTTEYKLPDTEMSNELKIKVEKAVKLEKILSLEEIEAQLKAKHVVFGIDYASIKIALERASGEPEIVAKGKKVQEGENGRIDFQTKTEVETITHEVNSQKQVDFRERFRFPSVSKGDLIAVVHPPVTGVPGETVTGKVIVPKPVRSVRFKCGEGVEFLEEKGEIIAQRDGRLIVSGNFIKVANLITHNGDVNLESGNVRFNGDIRIYGNITENMLVEARGDLFVNGNAYGAVVKAGGKIQFTRNVVKCQVEGGLHFALLKKIIQQISILEKEYAGFLNAVKKVVASLSEKGRELDVASLQRIIAAVSQKIPSSMKESLTKIESTLKDNDDRQFASLKKTIGLLQNVFSGKIDDIDSPLILNELGSSLRTFLTEVEDLLKEIPPLNVSYVQNSLLKHIGDIEITGAGSYYSFLQSGGRVNIHGVCRGGSIEAQGDVKVKEFCFISTESGSSASQVRIRVPIHSSIYFDLVHEDVTVQIGKIVYRFDNEYSKIKIGYDSESGMLKIVNF